MKKLIFQGQSGIKYNYEVHSINADLPSKAGNYIYLNANDKPLYIGITNDLSRRLEEDDHDGANCAKKNGATQIAINLNTREDDRLKQEKDLIKLYNPTCNTQHTR